MRTEAAVKVLRRIVGHSDKQHKDGKGNRFNINQHLINLKVGAKVARALAASQSDGFRQDALHFLQSLSSNREVGFEQQGLNLSDLVLISDNIKAANKASNAANNDDETHAQLLQSIELMMENHHDRPPPNKELFRTMNEAIELVQEAMQEDRAGAASKNTTQYSVLSTHCSLLTTDY